MHLRFALWNTQEDANIDVRESHAGYLFNWSFLRELILRDMLQTYLSLVSHCIPYLLS